MQEQHTSFLLEKTFPEGPKIALHLTALTAEKRKIHLLKSEEFTVKITAKSEDSFFQELMVWLEAYAQKKNLPRLNYPRQNLPPFTAKVLEIIDSIPFGKTLSYGEIAERAGSPRACRAVGSICRLNAWPLFIPCHRVLHKTELVGKYAFGSAIKKALLEYEGVF